eukprot:COSAG02_NODE_3530_length_6609_cov_13.933794_4_plen_115_part_00
MPRIVHRLKCRRLFQDSGVMFPPRNAFSYISPQAQVRFIRSFRCSRSGSSSNHGNWLYGGGFPDWCGSRSADDKCRSSALENQSSRKSQYGFLHLSSANLDCRQISALFCNLSA